jgi:hypothetical protein
MTSLRALSGLSASLLLLAAAACADDITQARAEAQAAASEPAPSANFSGPPPTLEISTRAWNNGLTDIPPLSGFYRVDVVGAGFPPGAGFESRTEVVFRDGMRWWLGGGRGVIPADGTFRTTHITNCPSRIREVYERVYSGGRWTESEHIAPAC